MKKILYVLFAVMTCLFVTGLVKADGPSYEIQSYRGTLILETWDDATYEEELVYHFTTSYNGQYVTLGSAGSNSSPGGSRRQNLVTRTRSSKFR